MSIKDDVITGLVGGISVGIGIGMYNTIERSWPFRRKKLYGWFKLKDDAVQILARANKVIEEKGVLAEDALRKMIRYYPDDTNERFSYEFEIISKAAWRSIDQFKIIRDKKTGRYMIKAPSPKIE